MGYNPNQDLRDVGMFRIGWSAVNTRFQEGLDGNWNCV